ncbi:MAG: glutamyl-tRNA amidotransferase, partial [Candidatus Portnoybacteria bacterium CG10_big_fil_rev_8_21_14_0_10_38_18]
ELEILKKYLPEQMDEGQIKEKAQKAIKESGATGPQDTGRVMSVLMSKLKGKADGSLVSKIVAELLNNL